MITQPTVLILGAGASAHLNFPLGKDLGQRVVAFLEVRHSNEFQQLLKLGFSTDHIEEFRKAYLYSGKSSIDAFLEHRREFIEVGKVAISQALIPFEDILSLFTKSENWYQFFYEKLNAPFSEFHLNNIGIITYNYDRSFEQYLFTALQNTYGKRDREVAEKLSSIPVIHVHGQLGHLPWQRRDGRAYGTGSSLDEVKASAESIKIIHEDIGSDSQFAEAHERLSRANVVIFLGFGYDETNLKRLNFDPSRVGTLYGSCFGFTRLERERLGLKFASRINLGQPDHQALRFLREEVILN